MTTMEWVLAQKANPAISQVITWIKTKKVDAVKISEEMSQEVKTYLIHLIQLCLVSIWRSVMERLQWGAIGDLVPPDYRLEAIHGAHDDIGHLGL